MTSKRKSFELQPAVVPQTVIPYLLQGEKMPEFLKEYNRLVDSDYKANPNLKVLDVSEINGIQTIIGSNSFTRPVLERILPGYAGMFPEEIETTLKEGDSMRVSGNHYLDTALVLDLSGANHNTALEFYNQLPQALRGLQIFPAVVVGYGLNNSKSGEYGLVPTYQEGTEVRTAKILSSKTGGVQFSAHDPELIGSGLPSQVGTGNRTLYTAQQGKHSLDNLGVRRLYVSRNLLVGSDSDLLADSDSGGRVAFVTREARAARKNGK